tara:strand:- start:4341 stop:5024 length:684 start_codon:yes stop_codon:yes gene_type:complete
MKKIYKVFLLIIALIFLSTFNPNTLTQVLNSKNKFFQIKNIIILNNSIIEKSEISKKLNHIYNKNIFSITRDDLEKPLKKIRFLKKIEVKKKYPDTIIVKILETTPVAYLYKDQKKYLLDSSSNLILFENNIDFNYLPSIFGEGAENNFINFLNLLKENNFSIKEVTNYFYFQIGRWDLQLKNNKTIKFPYNNIDEAIKKSIELLKRKDFENYKIIDLRVEGKIIVE